MTLVTADQEHALRCYFQQRGWKFYKTGSRPALKEDLEIAYNSLQTDKCRDSIPYGIQPYIQVGYLDHQHHLGSYQNLIRAPLFTYHVTDLERNTAYMYPCLESASSNSVYTHVGAHSLPDVHLPVSNKVDLTETGNINTRAESDHKNQILNTVYVNPKTTDDPGNYSTGQCDTDVRTNEQNQCVSVHSEGQLQGITTNSFCTIEVPDTTCETETRGTLASVLPPITAIKHHTVPWSVNVTERSSSIVKECSTDIRTNKSNIQLTDMLQEAEVITGMLEHSADMEMAVNRSERKENTFNENKNSMVAGECSEVTKLNLLLEIKALQKIADVLKSDVIDSKDINSDNVLQKIIMIISNSKLFECNKPKAVSHGKTMLNDDDDDKMINGCSINEACENLGQQKSNNSSCNTIKYSKTHGKSFKIKRRQNMLHAKRQSKRQTSSKTSSRIAKTKNNINETSEGDDLECDSEKMSEGEYLECDSEKTSDHISCDGSLGGDHRYSNKADLKKHRWTVNRNVRMHSYHRKCDTVPGDLDLEWYSVSEKGYFCPDCHFIFKCKNKLKQHKELKEGYCLKDCIYCDADEFKEIFQCPKCPKCFKTKELMEKHEQRHMSTVHICQFCNVDFYTIRDLKSHIHLDHDEVQEAFLCDLCGSEFKEKKVLNAHKKYVHTDNRPEKCTHCDRTFKTKSQLKNHLVVHKDISDLNLSCEICGKMFLRAGTLRDHVRRHKKEFMAYCGTCGKGFYRKYGLEEHMRIHTGDKPFDCKVCGYKCALSCNLVKHMKVHQKQNVV